MSFNEKTARKLFDKAVADIARAAKQDPDNAREIILANARQVAEVMRTNGFSSEKADEWAALFMTAAGEKCGLTFAETTGDASEPGNA